MMRCSDDDYFLIQNARTVIEMHDKLTTIRGQLAQSALEAISKLAASAKLFVIPQYAEASEEYLEEGLLQQESSSGLSAALDVSYDHVVCEIGRKNFMGGCMKSSIFLSVNFCFEEVFKDEKCCDIAVDMSPMSLHLKNLDRAKSIWIDHGLRSFFDDRGDRWIVDDNNRKVETFWGARFQASPFSPSEVAEAWREGELSKGLPGLKEAIIDFGKFLDLCESNSKLKRELSSRKRSSRA